MRLPRSTLRETLFRLSVWLKGLDGALELLGGVALYGVRPASIINLIALLTQDEITEDPRDLVAIYLRHAAAHLSVHGTHFLALYLLVHGIIKVALVQALLRRKLAAYPLAGIAFAAFIVYQLYRFTITRAFGLIALSVFDAVVIWLIYLEYRALRRRKMLLS